MLWYPPQNPRNAGKVIFPEKSSCLLVTHAPNPSAPCLTGSSFQGRPLHDRWTASAFTSNVETAFIPKLNETKYYNSKIILEMESHFPAQILLQADFTEKLQKLGDLSM